MAEMSSPNISWQPAFPRSSPPLTNSLGEGRSSSGSTGQTSTSERKVLECPRCFKQIMGASNLMAHLRTHTGEKPFTCDICLKDFSQRGNLIMHKRLHTGERPFKCDECGRTFTQKGNLKAHMRCHTGETPYECQYCPARFSQHSSLKSHLRNHYNELEHFLQSQQQHHNIQSGSLVATEVTKLLTHPPTNASEELQRRLIVSALQHQQRTNGTSGGQHMPMSRSQLSSHLNLSPPPSSNANSPHSLMNNNNNNNLLLHTNLLLHNNSSTSPHSSNTAPHLNSLQLLNELHTNNSSNSRDSDLGRDGASSSDDLRVNGTNESILGPHSFADLENAPNSLIEKSLSIIIETSAAASAVVAAAAAAAAAGGSGDESQGDSKPSNKNNGHRLKNHRDVLERLQRRAQGDDTDEEGDEADENKRKEKLGDDEDIGEQGKCGSEYDDDVNIDDVNTEPEGDCDGEEAGERAEDDDDTQEGEDGRRKMMSALKTLNHLNSRSGSHFRQGSNKNRQNNNNNDNNSDKNGHGIDDDEEGDEEDRGQRNENDNENDNEQIRMRIRDERVRNLRGVDEDEEEGKNPNEDRLEQTRNGSDEGPLSPSTSPELLKRRNSFSEEDTASLHKKFRAMRSSSVSPGSIVMNSNINHADSRSENRNNNTSQYESTRKDTADSTSSQEYAIPLVVTKSSHPTSLLDLINHNNNNNNSRRIKSEPADSTPTSLLLSHHSQASELLAASFVCDVTIEMFRSSLCLAKSMIRAYGPSRAGDLKELAIHEEWLSVWPYTTPKLRRRILNRIIELSYIVTK